MAKTEMKKAMFPREFVEWLIWYPQYFAFIYFQRNGVVYWRDSDDNEYTLDKMYKYWIFNVKNKEK